MGNVLHMLHFAILSIYKQVWFALNVFCFTKGPQIYVLPTAIAYRSAPARNTDIAYHVPYRTVCIVIHRCSGVSFQLVHQTFEPAN